MTELQVVVDHLHSFIEPEKVKVYSSFFKTGPGQYAEGDLFLGISTPNVRRALKKTKKLEVADILKLVTSKWHEERLLGLLVIERRFRFAKDSEKKDWVDLYLENLKYVNNWDLVDQTADKILGEFCFMKKDEAILYELVKSEILWERRVAVIASYAYIKHKDSSLIYSLAKLLLNDEHDLMHKAVGWMLREAGKRVDENELVIFLREYKLKMPRTMLRYAIERLSPELKTELMAK